MNEGPLPSPWLIIAPGEHLTSGEAAFLLPAGPIVIIATILLCAMMLGWYASSLAD